MIPANRVETADSNNKHLEGAAVMAPSLRACSLSIRLGEERDAGAVVVEFLSPPANYIIWRKILFVTHYIGLLEFELVHAIWFIVATVCVLDLVLCINIISTLI